MKVNLSIGLAMLVLALASMATTQAQQTSRTPVQPATDVDKLFANLYPVFSHPRCLNCHGVVVEPPGDDESVTKESHPAAEKDDPEKGAECGSCHDETDQISMLWGLAPPHLRWAGLDPDALCAIQATEAKRRNTRAGGTSPGKQGSYLHHIDHDLLIRQAWNGRAGGALPVDEKKAAPPGSHATFLAAATEWVNAGMPCRTNALVTQQETFSSSYSFAGPGPESTTSVSQTAVRVVVVRRLRDGRVEADIDMSGSQTFKTVTRATGANGPCTSTATTTDDWSRSSPRRVNARLRVTMTGKAGYRVAVTLPEVKTTQRSVQKIQGDCGVPPFSSADTVESEWPEWSIDIECPSTVPDGDVFCVPAEPQSFSAADGLIRRREATITADTTWLRESPAATNRADTGAPLLIESQTSWFFVSRRNESPDPLSSRMTFALFALPTNKTGRWETEHCSMLPRRQAAGSGAIGHLPSGRWPDRPEVVDAVVAAERVLDLRMDDGHRCGDIVTSDCTLQRGAEGEEVGARAPLVDRQQLAGRGKKRDCQQSGCQGWVNRAIRSGQIPVVRLEGSSGRPKVVGVLNRAHPNGRSAMRSADTPPRTRQALGLRIVAKTGPYEVHVIDSVEMPTPS